MALTGIKDVDLKILLYLDDNDLFNFYRTNTIANKLCQNQTFWLKKVALKYPEIPLAVMKEYKGDKKWSEYYIELNKALYSLAKSAENNRLDLVILTLAKGADIHVDSDYALIFASKNGYVDIVKYLVEQGIIIDIRTVSKQAEYIQNVLACIFEPPANLNDQIEVVKYLQAQFDKNV